MSRTQLNLPNTAQGNCANGPCVERLGDPAPCAASPWFNITFSPPTKRTEVDPFGNTCYVIEAGYFEGVVPGLTWQDIQNCRPCSYGTTYEFSAADDVQIMANIQLQAVDSQGAKMFTMGTGAWSPLSVQAAFLTAIQAPSQAPMYSYLGDNCYRYGPYTRPDSAPAIRIRIYWTPGGAVFGVGAVGGIYDALGGFAPPLNGGFPFPYWQDGQPPPPNEVYRVCTPGVTPEDIAYYNDYSLVELPSSYTIRARVEIVAEPSYDAVFCQVIGTTFTGSVSSGTFTGEWDDCSEPIGLRRTPRTPDTTYALELAEECCGSLLKIDDIGYQFTFGVPAFEAGITLGDLGDELWPEATTCRVSITSGNVNVGGPQELSSFNPTSTGFTTPSICCPIAYGGSTLYFNGYSGAGEAATRCASGEDQQLFIGEIGSVGAGIYKCPYDPVPVEGRRYVKSLSTLHVINWPNYRGPRSGTLELSGVHVVRQPTGVEITVPVATTPSAISVGCSNTFCGFILGSDTAVGVPCPQYVGGYVLRTVYDGGSVQWYDSESFDGRYPTFYSVVYMYELEITRASTLVPWPSGSDPILGSWTQTLREQTPVDGAPCFLGTTYTDFGTDPALEPGSDYLGGTLLWKFLELRDGPTILDRSAYASPADAAAAATYMKVRVMTAPNQGEFAPAFGGTMPVY